SSVPSRLSFSAMTAAPFMALCLPRAVSIAASTRLRSAGRVQPLTGSLRLGLLEGFVLRLQRGLDPLTDVLRRVEQPSNDAGKLVAGRRLDVQMLASGGGDEFRALDRRFKRGTQRRDPLGGNAGRGGERPPDRRCPCHEIEQRLVPRLDRLLGDQGDV